MLLCLHGYNNTPAACFERCDWLESLYGLEVVTFSWSSNRHRQGASDLPDFLPRCGEYCYLPPNDGLRQLNPAALALNGLTCYWWLVMALPGSPLHLRPSAHVERCRPSRGQGSALTLQGPAPPSGEHHADCYL